MFSRILVPTDFSEPSDAALAYARVLAGKFGASLHVLHVFESPFVAGAVSPEVFIDDSPAVQAQLLEEAKNRLQHRVSATDRAKYAATTEIVGGHSCPRHRRLRDGPEDGSHRHGHTRPQRRGASAHGQRRRESRAHRSVPGDDGPAGAAPRRAACRSIS